jgi:hypothetical protein
MDSLSIEKMKQTKTLDLTRSQIFWHFSIIPLLALPLIFATVQAIKYYFTENYNGPRPFENPFFPICWLILAISFYFIQKKRLKFKELHYSVDADTFKAAVKFSVEDMEWVIEKEGETYIIAHSKLSWGELITIIKEKDRILFNSICDPDYRPSIASFGNKMNRRIFEGHLQRLASPNNVLDNIEKTRLNETEEKTNEWTLGMTLFRIFAYPFCLFLICLGVYEILQPINFKSVPAGFGAIAFAVYYFYTDLSRLLKRKKANR